MRNIPFFVKTFWRHRILLLHCLLVLAILSPFVYRSCAAWLKEKNHEWFVATKDDLTYLRFVICESLIKSPGNATSLEDILEKIEVDKIDLAFKSLHSYGVSIQSVDGIIFNADCSFWREITNIYSNTGLEGEELDRKTLARLGFLFDERPIVAFYRKSPNPFMKHRYVCIAPNGRVFGMDEKPDIEEWKPSHDITICFPAMPELRIPVPRAAEPERVFVFKARK